MPEMVSGMCGVDFQELFAWQSTETRVRSETAGVIDQALDAGGECFHLSGIVQAVRRNEHCSRPDAAR